MRYAIHPRGIGRRPGARCVRDDTPLASGETFFVTSFTPDLVLAEDSVSLRERTPEEIDDEAAAVVAVDAERAAQAALAADARQDAVFDQLKSATASQINNFVNNQFSGFTAPQRAVMKLLIQTAALTLRRAG